MGEISYMYRSFDSVVYVRYVEGSEHLTVSFKFLGISRTREMDRLWYRLPGLRALGVYDDAALFNPEPEDDEE